MTVLGLRLTYSGLRAFSVDTSPNPERLIDEVYKDISALHLVPPPRKSIVRPEGIAGALDMFWEAPEQSTVYRQTRRCVENLNMNSPEIAQRCITSAHVYELPGDTNMILPDSRCIASATRSSTGLLLPPNPSEAVVTLNLSPPVPHSQAEIGASSSTSTHIQPPTAPRSMSLRNSGKLPQIKQEDTSYSSGNGSLVHRTLASRIQSVDPYPPPGVHRSTDAFRRSPSNGPRKPSRVDELTGKGSALSRESNAAHPASLSILGASAVAKRSELVEKASPHSYERENSLDPRDAERGRMVPEWRMLDEKDARRRAEAEAEGLRRQLAQFRERERENLHQGYGQQKNRLDDGVLIAVQKQLAQANTKVEALQHSQLRAEEARSLLLGHGGSALRGSGMDMVDIVKSIERQFKALGDELAKERALRQAAEDALHSTHNNHSISNSALLTGPGGSSLASNIVGSGFGDAGNGNSLNGTIYGSGATSSNFSSLAESLASIVHGQESQLVPSLLKTILELTQKNGSTV